MATTTEIPFASKLRIGTLSGDLLRSVYATTLVLLGMATGAGAVAAQSGALIGTVRAAATGDPLAEVTVTVEGAGIVSVTDRHGWYRLTGLPAGTLTVQFSLLGYAALRERVRLEVDASRTLDVALAVRAVQLRPVTVIVDRTRLVGAGSRIRELPGSAHVLDRAQVEDPRHLYDDVHGMLKQIPGVNVQEEEGYGLRPNIGLRGTGVERSSKITLMEDGVLIAPAPYAAPAAYYFPVAGRMEGIEVRKGSSQIKYGPLTVGGAINFVSSSIPDELTLSGEAEAGGDDTRKLHARVGDAYENFGWMAEAYQLRTSGFKELDGGGETGFDIEDYLVKLRLNVDPTARVYQELELKLGYTDGRSNETYLGLTEDDFQRNPLRRYAASQRDVMDTEHHQVLARHFIQATRWLDITTTAYRNDFARNWYKVESVDGTSISDVLRQPGGFPDELAVLRGGNSDPGALRLRANNREYYAQGVQAQVGLRFGERVRNELEVGLRYHRDEEDRFQHEDAYQMMSGSMVLTAPGAPGSQTNRVGEARAWAVFVQHTVSAGRLTVTPGVRYEHIDFTRTDYATDDPDRTAATVVRENGVTAWIPGIGASYALGPVVSVFGGVHRGFGPPGPGAAPETEPERSVNYELGARGRLSAVDAQVVGFFSDYQNILGRATLATGETGTGELFNGGAVRVVGAEVALSAEPRASRGGAYRLPLRLSYTFTRATFETSFESDFEPWGEVEAGDRLPYLPEHQLFASAGLEHPRWGASLSATYTGQMRTVAGRGEPAQADATDRALVLGLGAQLTIATRSSVFAAVQNLADERYVVARRPAGARPGLPRTFLAGVRLNR
jgi:Fe(3+) dicitrate transport protein